MWTARTIANGGDIRSVSIASAPEEAHEAFFSSSILSTQTIKHPRSSVRSARRSHRFKTVSRLRAYSHAQISRIRVAILAETNLCAIRMHVVGGLGRRLRKWC